MNEQLPVQLPLYAEIDRLKAELVKVTEERDALVGKEKTRQEHRKMAENLRRINPPPSLEDMADTIWQGERDKLRAELAAARKRIAEMQETIDQMTGLVIGQYERSERAEAERDKAMDILHGIGLALLDENRTEASLRIGIGTLLNALKPLTEDEIAKGQLLWSKMEAEAERDKLTAALEGADWIIKKMAGSEGVAIIHGYQYAASDVEQGAKYRKMIDEALGRAE